MKVILFGASGMVGQGVLRECLIDDSIERVISIVRKPTGQSHPRLREIVHTNFLDYSGIEADLTGLDACFYCLGISSAGMSEADYRRVTYDYTVAAATTLSKLNPGMSFVFVSGAGTDSSEKGRLMWARVKGAAENALFEMPLEASAFRPGVIQPMDGIRSKTRLYQFFYSLLGPLLSLLRPHFPKYMTSTRQIGRAMIKVARDGAPKKILESVDINLL